MSKPLNSTMCGNSMAIIAALRDCTLSDQRRFRCCALLGRNGAGKTTLLAHSGRAVAFSTRRVTLFGENPRSDNARRQIGFLGHGIGVYEDLSAHENLEFLCRNFAAVAAASSRGHSLAAARRVGSRRRHAGAPVFARHAAAPGAGPHLYACTEILLLDEPFTSLDDRLSRC